MIRKIRTIIPVIMYRLSVLTVCKAIRAFYDYCFLSNSSIAMNIKMVVVTELSRVRHKVEKNVENEKASMKNSIRWWANTKIDTYLRNQTKPFPESEGFPFLSTSSLSANIRSIYGRKNAKKIVADECIP